MTDEHHIEFWFDFGSNYSYLSVMRIEADAARAGVRVRWKPFLLGPVFEALGMRSSPFVLQKEKGAYVWQDMARECRKYALPWTRPGVFPRRAVLPTRVALVGAEQPWMGAYCRRIMSLNFADDREIDSIDVVEAALRDLGLPARTLIDEAQSEANKATLRRQTDVARMRGLFGAPTFFVGDQMFWGNDRLDDALAFAGEAP